MGIKQDGEEIVIVLIWVIVEEAVWKLNVISEIRQFLYNLM